MNLNESTFANLSDRNRLALSRLILIRATPSSLFVWTPFVLVTLAVISAQYLETVTMAITGHYGPTHIVVVIVM